MLSKEANKLLAQEIANYVHDPLGFVLFAFEWGKNELSQFTSPDTWQIELLQHLGNKLKEGYSVVDVVDEAIKTQEPVQTAISSGHGIGKSAFVSWIILWAMSTFPDTKGVVTANTENQLKTKTWAELAKWYRLCLCKDWFEYTATALFSKDKAHEKTWRIDMVPWSERNTEAFAGLHNKNKRILIIFDEASAIPDVIWEVTEGALTDEDTEIIWCTFGNPTRNTGRFRECFGRFSHRWHTRKIDSRSAKMTNKEQLNKWVEDYGEDSDFVRVRVRGEFPNAGSMQFIPSSDVRLAKGRNLQSSAYNFAPVVIGVDVARFGDDSSVITIRQGLYCRPQLAYRGVDLMDLCGIVSRLIDKESAQMVFVDGVGVGGGVIDRLRQLGYSNITDVQSAGRAMKPIYANKRAEMWGEMKDWLKQGGIPEDTELCEQLESVEYKFNKSNAYLLEAKEDMKKRGLSSPDKADSLALTFHSPVHAIRASTAKAKTSYSMWG